LTTCWSESAESSAPSQAWTTRRSRVTTRRSTPLSVIRNLTVIGEAANRLPQEIKDPHVDVPRHRIVGLRHRVVHDYFDVDLDLVWAIVETELPQLAAQLSGIQ
jgi:uncharacterized protein with HEPN domain